MLSALLRPFQGNSSRAENHEDLEEDSAFRPSVAEYRRHLHATADFTEADDDDEEESNDGEQSRYPLGGRPEDEDGMARSSGLLPLFSANQLDSLPIYSMTHAIRIIVQARTETTLSWEQLRSPQVSQFLVKPMQQQIRAQHFSPATLYALMANCLQFEKEGQLYPATAGTSATRARVCELLAIKLLKEYTTRELIDALCHDFYPLQGIPGTQTPLASGGRPRSTVLRTSTLEVAIRASAKHFLCHPLVVQHIEAIWNGAINFSSPAEESQRQGSTSSAAGSNQSRRQSTVRTPLLADQRIKAEPTQSQPSPDARRSVTLYNPRTASLFKLSRLRVPRYRRLLSTGSLLVLTCLFLTVLGQRSSKITTVELLFWFWSAGFMLDELVGFNEQGFSFYVMSFWNIFDLGILLLLIVYYCMRIYGVFLLDPHRWNQNAYDVLAVNAILLLPRIFGVLEHYRYFSRLLISLRLLAIDLAAVFVLIFIGFGGFFVFFAFSKGPDDASAVAYKMFQILMGFTPPAWEMWSSYNWMGKGLMGLFLVIGHFVILTMLISVLTNSFMSITSRASEEYQFSFAINTISMAKNDALFSYVAPGNIFAWALMPLRYCMSMSQYVSLNRALIKITHSPLLFCIYFYEKCFLAPDMYEATDLIDNPRRGRHHAFSDPASRSAFFSPSIRIREESVVGYQRDRALEEVFRRAPEMRTQRRVERRKTQTEIRSWMEQQEPSPQNYSTIDSRMGSDWQGRLSVNRERPSRFPRHYSDIRSTASDPADLISDIPYSMAAAMFHDGIARRDYAVEAKDHTDADADGDDELVTNDEDEGDDVTNNMDDGGVGDEAIEEDYFTTPIAARFTNTELSADSPRPATSRRIPLHTRTLSTNTILYAPEEDNRPYSSSSASAWPATASKTLSRPLSTRHTPITTPITPGGGANRPSPRRALYLASSRPRSMIQPGEAIPRNRNSGSGHSNGLTLDIPNTSSPSPRTKGGPPIRRRRSLPDLADGGHGGGGNNNNNNNNSNTLSSPNPASVRSTDSNKLMLARMKLLEVSLGSMVREMRTLRRSACNSDEDGAAPAGGGGGDGREGGSAAMSKRGSGSGSGSWGRYLAQQQHHQQLYRDRERRDSQDQDRYRERDRDQERYQHHQGGRGTITGFRAGSDPSSGFGGGARSPLVEVAIAGAGSAAAVAAVDAAATRERGSRRARTVTAASGTGAGTAPVTLRRVAGPGARRPLLPQGAWRSPGAEGTTTSGLGITGDGDGGAGKGKGRERERVAVGNGAESSPGMGGSSPSTEELDAAGKGMSL